MATTITMCAPLPSQPSEGESATGDEDEGDEPLRTDTPGKANRCRQNASTLSIQHNTIIFAVSVISCYLLSSQPSYTQTHTHPHPHKPTPAHPPTLTHTNIDSTHIYYSYSFTACYDGELWVFFIAWLSVSVAQYLSVHFLQVWSVWSS